MPFKDNLLISNLPSKVRVLLETLADQVDYSQEKINAIGLEIEQIRFGRDDTHHFFEILIEKWSESQADYIMENPELLANPENTPLIYSMITYICDECNYLHLVFYLKTLSPNNPFRYKEAEDLLEYYGESQNKVLH